MNGTHPPRDGRGGPGPGGKSFVLTALLVLAAGCGGGAAPAPLRDPAKALSWNQSGGSASRSRCSLETGPLTAPGIVWSSPIAATGATEPVVARADGRVLALVAGGDRLRAFHLDDGREAWAAELGGSLSSAPAICGDRVVIGSLDGFVVSLDAATGGERRVHEADYTFEAPPLTQGALVIFEETRHAGPAPTSRIHAFEGPLLTERWTADLTGGVGCAPASDGESVFIQTSDAVTALSLLDGRSLWRRERERRRQSLGPVVEAGRVLVQSVSRLPSAHLTALDAGTGASLWEEELPSRALATPALSEEAVFLVLASNGLQRREAATGELSWERALPARSEAAPVVGATLVFVGGEGFVAAHDRGTGEPVWTLALDGRVASLALARESLLVTSSTGFLHRLESPR